MKEEDKKPKDVPINPNRVVKGGGGVRYRANQEDKEYFRKTGKERYPVSENIMFEGPPKPKKQLYQEQSGSGCMVALLLMIIPSILLSLLLF
tara:strand:+ start:1302 stop:1577 length:276 start_codon:yes stop_codon:yes gene_type:complete